MVVIAFAPIRNKSVMRKNAKAKTHSMNSLTKKVSAAKKSKASKTTTTKTKTKKQVVSKDVGGHKVNH